MKIGIVGLPNVGKSTLFKALTKIQVDINNYPFCTIEPNIGIVEVPDERLDKLVEFSHSKKRVPAIIEFVDIAGLVEGAAEGQGLGNKFLAHIREVDAIVQVVRLFNNNNIIHVRGKINPKEDIGIINTELILADLDTVQKRIVKLQKEARAQNKEALKTLEIAEKLKSLLDKNELNTVQNYIKNLGDDFDLIRDFHLLSFKPILYVFNTATPKEIEADLKNFGLNIDNYVALDIKTEEDLLELSAEEARELELESNLSKLIKKSYALLGLITYLTTGEQESRAWTIPAGSTAPRAGRAIHGDFEKKFICAEVIHYDKLIAAESKTKAKELGMLRTEGKQYIVQDGDVIEFKI
jgi:GTP-binding protein YchF